jgi:hypothetical protein
LNIKIIEATILILLLTGVTLLNPALAKTKIENNTNELGLEPGDIYMEFRYSFYLEGHTRLFIEYNQENNEYVFIQAGIDGFEYFNCTKDFFEGFVDPYAFLRVKSANETQKFNAIEYAKAQSGSTFQFIWLDGENKNFNSSDTENDPLAKQFYCTEIIWAAYYNCNHHPDEKICGEGIDIDKNGFEKDSRFKKNLSAVWTRDILEDDDIEIIKDFEDKNTPVKSFLRIIYNICRMVVYRPLMIYRYRL